MGHKYSKVFSFLIFLFFMVSVGVWGQSTTSSKVTLKIWHAAFVMPDERALPESQWTINKIFREYEATHPGVTIEGVLEGDQSLLQNKLKAAVLANTAPDIANIFSGALPTAYKDILVDLTPFIPKDDLKLITGWEAVSLNLKRGNPILGYPAAGAEFGCLVYSKKLVAAAGVDLEGPGKPKNSAEFIVALKKIKASGVLPIEGSNADGYNGAFMFAFGNWWAQQVGIERAISNATGITRFVDDTAFLDSLGLVAQMYKDGLINKDYASHPDGSALFNSGKAAMKITGNWDVGTVVELFGDDAGLYIAPNFKNGVKYNNASIGGVGQAFVVLKTSKNVKQAVDFLSWYSNKANVIRMAKVLSKLPQRTDVSSADMDWVGKPLYEKMLAIAADNLLPWIDNAMPPDVANEYYKLTALVVTGQMTAKECAVLLDKKAAEVKAKN